MTGSNPHSAAGQAAGYFYQIERAVARLAEADNSATVALEKEDEVSVRMQDGRMILEQDKHMLGIATHSRTAAKLFGTHLTFGPPRSNRKDQPDCMLFLHGHERCGRWRYRGSAIKRD